MEEKKARLLETEDGSPTIYLSEYDESMHSSHGAYSESIIKHIEPSGILERKGPCGVLDIGFGMGYNVLALLVSLSSVEGGEQIDIISFEKEDCYRDLLNQVRFDDLRDNYYRLVRRAFENGEASEGRFRIRLLFGDARKRIGEVPDNFADAVFQDPFSPARNPELWNIRFFKQVRRAMKKNGRLTTYSGALHVREALVEAGFAIGRGPGMGKKREGTVASPNSFPGAFNEKELSGLKEMVKATPYQDLTGSDSREEILARRLNAMAVLREKRG